MSDKPEAMTEAHTPTPVGKLKRAHFDNVSVDCDGSFSYTELAEPGASLPTVIIVTRNDSDLDPKANYVQAAVNSHARLLKEREELRAALTNLLAAADKSNCDSGACDEARAALLTLKDKE